MKNNDPFDELNPRRLYVSPAAWMEFDSTTVALFVLLAAFVLGFTPLGNKAWDALASTRAHAVDLPFQGSVLVVGANLKSQTAIRLIASPRGYQSIFVASGDEAITRLQQDTSSFKVAVIDQEAPGGARTLATIRRLLPVDHVIALHGAAPNADIAQLLLDVL